MVRLNADKKKLIYFKPRAVPAMEVDPAEETSPPLVVGTWGEGDFGDGSI